MFPSYLEVIKQYSVPLVVGLLLIGVAIVLFMVRVRWSHRSCRIAWLPVLLLGAVYTFVAGRAVWNTHAFRNEISAATVVSIRVHPFIDENVSRQWLPAYVVNDQSRIAGLFDKLDDAKTYFVNHEAAQEGFLLRFERHNGELSRHALEVWTKTTKGDSAILMPGPQNGTVGADGFYWSSDFVAELTMNR